MDEEHRLTVPGVLTEVPHVCAFVVEAAESAGLDDQAAYQCQVAVDEWCTNIIEHGFARQNAEIKRDDTLQNTAPPSGWIEVDLLGDAHSLTIIITDDGPPFDPTILADPPLDVPIEDREPGGLGWFLLKKMMDDVQYEYVDSHNRLRMTKHMTNSQPPNRHQPITFPAYELSDNLWVISPAGRLDANGGLLLESTLTAYFSARQTVLIVDMSEVTYISSGGLKALLSAFKRARERGGAIALAGMTPRVIDIFAMSGFDALFEITPTVQAAADRLAARFPSNKRPK